MRCRLLLSVDIALPESLTAPTTAPAAAAAAAAATPAAPAAPAAANPGPTVRSVVAMIWSSFFQSPWARRCASLSSSAAFFVREKVLQKAASKREASGTKIWRIWTGRKPPMSSDESDCSDRLCTSSTLPSERARCCTAVVLPVPVSPTSSTASSMRTHAATRSMSRSVWRVCANAPVPLVASPPSSSESRLALAAVERGRDTRPTFNAEGVILSAGLWSDAR